MNFNPDFLRRYLEIAPLALAIERSMECEILAAQSFERPILDIGCGDGVFAAILFAERIDTGIDSDPAEIARATTYDRYDELIACGAATVPKPDGSYQTIFSNSVLEHIPDLRPVLREQHRLLAPGGRFYVTIPTDRWETSTAPARLLGVLGLPLLAKKYARFYNSFWKHYHAYSAAQWVALFQEAGFTIVEERLYAAPNMTTLLDLLTPLAAPGMFNKKLLGCWIAFPALRKALAPTVTHLLARPLSLCKEQKGGNLLFLALTK